MIHRTHLRHPSYKHTLHHRQTRRELSFENSIKHKIWSNQYRLFHPCRSAGMLHPHIQSCRHIQFHPRIPFHPPRGLPCPQHTTPPSHPILPPHLIPPSHPIPASSRSCTASTPPAYNSAFAPRPAVPFPLPSHPFPPRAAGRRRPTHCASPARSAASAPSRWWGRAAGWAPRRCCASLAGAAPGRAARSAARTRCTRTRCRWGSETVAARTGQRPRPPSPDFYILLILVK